MCAVPGVGRIHHRHSDLERDINSYMMELEDVLRFSKQLQGSISCSKQQNV